MVNTNVNDYDIIHDERILFNLVLLTYCFRQSTILLHESIASCALDRLNLLAGSVSRMVYLKLSMHTWARQPRCNTLKKSHQSYYWGMQLTTVFIIFLIKVLCSCRSLLQSFCCRSLLNGRYLSGKNPIDAKEFIVSPSRSYGMSEWV